MNWYANSWKKEYFLITPEEFKSIFKSYHFVVTNTGVKKDYTETNPDIIFESYRLLYSELSTGKKFKWNDDWKTVGFNTGVTANMDNFRYSPATRLSIPDFSEPCIYIEPFCVLRYKESPVSKGWEISQFPQNTFGLEMSVPKRISYFDGQTKTLEEFTEYSSWIDINSKVKKIAKILRVEYNGKVYNTKIRVSQLAKEDLERFYVIKDLNLKLL